MSDLGPVSFSVFFFNNRSILLFNLVIEKPSSYLLLLSMPHSYCNINILTML